MSDRPVDLSRPRYDQSTFSGRLKHFLGIIDFRFVVYGPNSATRTLLTSDAQIEVAKNIIKDYQDNGVIPEDNVDKLWAAKKGTVTIAKLF